MTINFQSLHVPRGANAHLALGLFGSGGFAIESDRAAANEVFIGWKRGNQIACLPFFRNAQSAELAGFIGEQAKPALGNHPLMSKILLAQDITERIPGIPADPRADKAHADWWRIGCPSNPGIDQVFLVQFQREISSIPAPIRVIPG